MTLVSYAELPDDLVRRTDRVTHAPQRRPIDRKSSGSDIQRAFTEAGDTIPWVVAAARGRCNAARLSDMPSSADPDVLLLDPEAYQVEAPDKAWFVLQVAPTHGAPDRVRRLADMRGYTVYWPRRIEMIVRGRGLGRRNVPLVSSLYARYVLVHMPARGTPRATAKGEPTIGAPWGADFGRMTDAEARFYGVSGFLRSLDGPLAVPNAVVARIVAMEREGAFSALRPKGGRVVGALLDWQFVGALVRVASGPFASFDGVIEDVDEGKQRAKVAVHLFGRLSIVEMDLAQLESLL